MSLQQEKFTEIADAIRSKLGTTEKIKPSDFASKINEIQGGGDSHYDTFWDTYQVKGGRTHYNYAFYQVGWNDDNYNPKYPFGTPEYTIMMFGFSEITDTKQPMDFSKVRSQPSGVYQNCFKMKTIRTITVAENNTFVNWFTNCKELENITFAGTIGQSISFADSPLLSADSIANIVEHLATVSAKTTITINSAIDMSAYKSTIEGKGWTLVQ